MIKKLTNFFCILPLLGALGAAQVTANDHSQPPVTDSRKKENIEDCIKKIREQQNKIKGEVEKIKKIIRDRKNRQDKDRA